MKRQHVPWVGLALALGATQAYAEFSLAVSQPVGAAQQATNLRLQAATRGPGDEQVFMPPGVPSSGAFAASAGSGGSTSRVDETYHFAPDTLSIGDAYHLDGPAQVVSSGAWVFQVERPVWTSLSGFLTYDSGRVGELDLEVLLDDLSTGAGLLQSIQRDSAAQRTLVVGGLSGTRGAALSGSLSNQLVPDHFYRLSYTISAADFESSAGQRTGSAGLVLASSVPEPAQWALLLLSGGILLSVVGRPKTGA